MRGASAEPYTRRGGAERYASDVREALARLEFASTRIMHRSDESVLIVGATAAVSAG